MLEAELTDFTLAQAIELGAADLIYGDADLLLKPLNVHTQPMVLRLTMQKAEGSQLLKKINIWNEDAGNVTFDSNNRVKCASLNKLVEYLTSADNANGVLQQSTFNC